MAKILIIDNSTDIVDTYGKFLEHAGHQVVGATNGQEALLHVISDKPDVVLLDLFMPEMDGPSFL